MADAFSRVSDPSEKIFPPPGASTSEQARLDHGGELRPSPVAPGEAQVEQQEGSGGGTAETPAPSPVGLPAHPTAQPQSAPLPAGAAEELQQIEAILSEGLEQDFSALPPPIQVAFRKEGERIAAAIQVLLEHSRAVARQIAELIRKWLGMIPGANRFFLEQEAKIKTDQLLELRRRE
ncbi:hypothetical protein HZA86_01495 [Candidatus Uhrbacteria bacterium]|nr:hypothetical protein [Candidatus Uhrbacteria bacterium]